MLAGIEERMWYNEHDGYYQVEYGASYWAYSANLYVFGGNSRKRFDMYHRGRLKTSFLRNQIIIIVFQNQLMTPSINSVT